MRRWTSRDWSGCFGAWRQARSRSSGCDLTEPSPLALEALSARPYAFLDDAPLEERRTQAVMAQALARPAETRPTLAGWTLRRSPRFSPRPGPIPSTPRSFTTRCSGSVVSRKQRPALTPGWSEWLDALARDKRVALLKTPHASLWIPAERLAQFHAVWPEARLEPEIAPPAEQAGETWSAKIALVEILRGRLEGLGPVTPTALAAPLGLEPNAIAAALAALETRRRDSQGAFPSRPQRRAMVRPAPPGAHPSLYGRKAAGGDRAGGRARLSPLPVRMAACRGRDAPRGAGRAASDLERARRLRGAGEGVGDRDPAGATQGLSGFVARRPMPGRAHVLGASDAAVPRQRRRRTRHVSPVGSTPIALIERRRAPLVDGARAVERRGPDERTRSSRARRLKRARRLVL